MPEQQHHRILPRRTLKLGFACLLMMALGSFCAEPAATPTPKAIPGVAF